MDKHLDNARMKRDHRRHWPFLTLGPLLIGMALAMLGMMQVETQAAPASCTTIYVDAAATGVPDGCSWDTAYTNLQSALTAASSGDEIWVAQGTYTPTNVAGRAATFQLLSGVALYGGFAGDETARSQRNWSVYTTTLSGDIGTLGNASDNAYHVVTGAGTAVLDGFVVTGGNANGTDPHDQGGGMLNAGVAPVVRNVIFSNNTALGGGGGMGNKDFASPTLVNVVFANNTAIGDSFSGGYGGGLQNNYYCHTLLVNVTFLDNQARLGGGIRNYWSNPTLVNVTFTGNVATGDFFGNRGGAMANANSAPVVSNSVLWGDTAPEVIRSINSADVTTINYSLVQGGCPPASVCDANLVTTNPRFLDADGRLDPDYPSPAIDVGDNTAIPLDTTDVDGDGDTAEQIPLDLDVNARVVNDTVDLGAYEVPASGALIYLPLVAKD